MELAKTKFLDIQYLANVQALECDVESFYTKNNTIVLPLEYKIANSVGNLLRMSESGELSDAFQETLVTGKLKQQHGIKSLKLSVKVDRWQCLELWRFLKLKDIGKHTYASLSSYIEYLCVICES